MERGLIEDAVEYVILEVSPKYVRRVIMYNFLLLLGFMTVEAPLIIIDYLFYREASGRASFVYDG